MQILFLIFMFVLGAALGSFLCCQVRRMEEREGAFEGIRSAAARGRAREPRGARPLGRELPKANGSERRGPKKPSSSLPIYSICLHCKKKLKWYDNVPIISWCVLRGKCRFCHKKIGYAEVISELASAITLTMLGTTINVETANVETWFQFVLITIFTLSLLFLAIYDGISGKLPTIMLITSVILGAIAITPSLVANFSPMPFISAAVFGGIYLLLYLISKGKWVGDGDWILAGGIGLVLGHPWLALMALFIANFSACLIMYPLVKNKKNHQIYFGPFLVLAFVITYTFRDIILLCIS